MKTFKVKYKEVIMHEFYVDAESEDDVFDEFDRMVDNNQIDFSDGDLVEGNIETIEEA